MEPRTLFQKVWDDHVVVQEPDRPAVLYIDLQLIHEVTSPQAFTGLRERGLKVRRPDKTIATMDHSTPTLPKALWVIDDQAKAQLGQLESNCKEFGVELFALGDSRNGIVHVIGPERGFTQPGKTIVCGDSHTSTHGAFGALAFGIGTSEVEHVLATQCLLQRKAKTLEVRVEGQLMPGVTAKDIILALCAEIGTGGGTGYVIEFTGSAIRSLDMEGRMTVCNMSIEAGARAGMIAPDETTFEYLKGRERVPRGADWDAAVERWRQLCTDEGATFDKTVIIDANKLEPMITYGTNPGMGIQIGESMPTAGSFDDASQQAAFEKAMGYMGLQPGQPLLGKKIDVGARGRGAFVAQVNSVINAACFAANPGDFTVDAETFRTAKEVAMKPETGQSHAVDRAVFRPKTKAPRGLFGDLNRQGKRAVRCGGIAFCNDNRAEATCPAKAPLGADDFGRVKSLSGLKACN